jgi:hypothetical protein
LNKQAKNQEKIEGVVDVQETIRKSQQVMKYRFVMF